jgi:PKD repeat protein
MVSKRETACPADTLQFDDYSMLDHAGATWEWQFPGGDPATSTLRNPRVVYHTAGEYDVTLTVTNADGASTKTVPDMVRILELVVNTPPVINDFSGGLGDLQILNPDGGITWSPVNITTCEPGGDSAYYVDNYTYSSYGQDEILLPVNLDLTQIPHPVLSFRVAYAPYYDGNAFIDSLKVLISHDCGSSFRTFFRSGGEALSTTTSGQGPNNLYEYEPFSPKSCEEWRTVDLDLSEYFGQYVTIKFLNQSGYGNNMYLDDISLNGDLLVGAQHPAFLHQPEIRPNPTTGTAVLTGTVAHAGDITVLVRNPAGQTVWSQTLHRPAGKWELTLPAERLPAGIYWVSVTSENGAVQAVRKLVKQ